MKEEFIESLHNKEELLNIDTALELKKTLKVDILVHPSSGAIQDMNNEQVYFGFTFFYCDSWLLKRLIFIWSFRPL